MSSNLFHVTRFSLYWRKHVHEEHEQMANLQAQDDLPPYFGINPDQAEQDLGPAMGTAGFQDLAEACAKGRADLVGRGPR
jgi:hypothetical protein